MPVNYEQRLDLLEAAATLQIKLRDAQDQIHELKRDGDIRIAELEAALSTALRTRDRWQQEHSSCGAALAMCAGLLVISLVAHIWRYFA